MADKIYHVNDDAPVLVKTLDSYGINMVSSYGDYDLIGKKINSSPLVQYYNAFGKAIFDYSNTESTDDLDYIEILLQGITNGNTFTVTNGYYVKDQDGITSNINGVYQFDGAQNDNLLLTTKISASALNTAETRYERDYFVDPPQITLNSGFTGDSAYIIKSVTNNGAISNLGLYEDDLIEISYTGNTANIDRCRVQRVETTSQGEELIFLKDSIVNDNRIGQLTTLNVYVRGTPSIDLLGIDKTLNGSAKTYRNDGYYLDCFENQNELQGYLRRFKYGAPNVLSTWVEDTDCSTFNSGYETNGLSFDEIITVKVTQLGTLLYEIHRKDSTIEFSPNLSLSAGVYKFDQSHFSNYDSENKYQIVFTRTEGNVASALMTEYYTTNSVAGRENSYTILTITSNTPSVFYYEALGVTGIGGTIEVSS